MGGGDASGQVYGLMGEWVGYVGCSAFGVICAPVMTLAQLRTHDTNTEHRTRLPGLGEAVKEALTPPPFGTVAAKH